MNYQYRTEELTIIWQEPAATDNFRYEIRALLKWAMF